jgi:hypothetical protein
MEIQLALPWGRVQVRGECNSCGDYVVLCGKCQCCEDCCECEDEEEEESDEAK